MPSFAKQAAFAALVVCVALAAGAASAQAPPSAAPPTEGPSGRIAPSGSSRASCRPPTSAPRSMA